MNVDEWIEYIIVSDKKVALPIMTHPGIELLNKRVLDAVTDGEVHFKAVEALNMNYPQSAACTVIMDLTVEAEAFGAQIQFSENEVPNVIGRLVSNYEEVVGLKIPTLDIARIPQYLEANRLAAKGLDKPVLGGCIGPYSLAGRLFDMTEIMMAIYTEPETALLLLDKCTQFITQYCRAIKDCGSAGVIIAEPAAGLLSNEDCMQYSSVFVKRIVEEVQDSHFAVILHNCGNMGQCTQAMVATGAKGYHFGNKIDMLAALEECPSNALAMGNLDPVGIFKQATAEEVYRQTYTLLQKTTAYPNFVISTGCDVPPEIPLDNIRAFYEAVKDYNQKQ